MSVTSTVSGMASRIRACIDNETFDLAGQNETSITNTISQAFKEPFPLTNEMVRLTFIVGAGKLGRQRYDEGAARAVTTTLRAMDFQEDQGASCVIECAGTYKLQHDTGKNLKTVVVFPKITASSSSKTNDDNNNSQLSDPCALSALSLEQQSSPEHVCAMSSLTVFSNMLKNKCPSWSQKKGCLQVLQDIVERTKLCESKLLKGDLLTQSEQEWYDAISLEDIYQKENLVKKEMAAHVEDGRITMREKKILLSQVSERIEKLQQEITDACKEKKAKKEETLTHLKCKAEQRKKAIEDIAPQAPHSLKHHLDIVKLRQELKPLLKLEESCKGRLLSLKEATTLARKDEILNEIIKLEELSRGWFEDDELFSTRLQQSRRDVPNTDNKKTVKKPSTSSSGGISSSKSAVKCGTSSGAWSTVPAKQKTAPPHITSNSQKSSGGIFAAMMADSDSD